MKLSIGMMVKNEGRHLEECLESIQPILNNIESELIIIDTGSDDNTVEIARKYTNKLYFHKWDNKFSEMRNKTISYCSGEWFFCLDGDEVIESCEAIIEFFNTNEYKKYNSAIIKGKNLTSYKNKENYNSIDTIRFFKNTSEFEFRGNVHNQPVFKEPTKYLDASLLHYGYIQEDKELMEKKFKRTATILKNELEKNPESIYYRFQLSASYSMYGDSSKALEEIEKAYNNLKKSNKKKSEYKYLYIHYTMMLISNNKFKEIEDIASEGIKLSSQLTVDKIDLYYYMAKAQFSLNKDDEAIKNYKIYLELVDKYEKKEIMYDTSIVTYTIPEKNNAILHMAIIYYRNDELENVRKYVSLIEKPELLSNAFNMIYETYRKCNDLDKIIEFYLNKVKPLEKKYIDGFIEILEKEILKLNKEEKKVIYKAISKLDDNYGELNNIRYLYLTNNSNVNEKNEELINIIDFNKVEFFYGDLIYIYAKNNGNIDVYLKGINYESIQQYFIYLFNRYDDFNEVLLNHVEKYYDENTDDFYELRIMKVYLRNILIIDKLNESNYEMIFKWYINLGIKYMEIVYNKSILDNQLINELKNDEEKFLMYIYSANKIREKDKINYVKNLKNALEVDKIFRRGINILLSDIKNKYNKENQINNLKIEFIKNIEQLLMLELYDNVKELIDEYEKIIGTDIEIIKLKSLYLINKKNS